VSLLQTSFQFGLIEAVLKQQSELFEAVAVTYVADHHFIISLMHLATNTIVLGSITQCPFG